MTPEAVQQLSSSGRPQRVRKAWLKPGCAQLSRKKALKLSGEAAPNRALCGSPPSSAAQGRSNCTSDVVVDGQNVLILAISSRPLSS